MMKKNKPQRKRGKNKNQNDSSFYHHSSMDNNNNNNNNSLLNMNNHLYQISADNGSYSPSNWYQHDPSNANYNHRQYDNRDNSANYQSTSNRSNYRTNRYNDPHPHSRYSSNPSHNQSKYQYSTPKARNQYQHYQNHNVYNNNNHRNNNNSHSHSNYKNNNNQTSRRYQNQRNKSQQTAEYSGHAHSHSHSHGQSPSHPHSGSHSMHRADHSRGPQPPPSHHNKSLLHHSIPHPPPHQSHAAHHHPHGQHLGNNHHSHHGGHHNMNHQRSVTPHNQHLSNHHMMTAKPNRIASQSSSVLLMPSSAESPSGNSSPSDYDLGDELRDGSHEYHRFNDQVYTLNIEQVTKICQILGQKHEIHDKIKTRAHNQDFHTVLAKFLLSLLQKLDCSHCGVDGFEVEAVLLGGGAAAYVLDEHSKPSIPKPKRSIGRSVNNNNRNNDEGMEDTKNDDNINDTKLEHKYPPLHYNDVDIMLEINIQEWQDLVTKWRKSQKQTQRKFKLPYKNARKHHVAVYAAIRTAFLECLREFAPEDMQSMDLKDICSAYIDTQKRVMCQDDDVDRMGGCWAIYRANHDRGRCLDLTVIHKMRRRYIFSTDSFRIKISKSDLEFISKAINDHNRKYKRQQFQKRHRSNSYPSLIVLKTKRQELDDKRLEERIIAKQKKRRQLELEKFQQTMREMEAKQNNDKNTKNEDNDTQNNIKSKNDESAKDSKSPTKDTEDDDSKTIEDKKPPINRTESDPIQSTDISKLIMPLPGNINPRRPFPPHRGPLPPFPHRFGARPNLPFPNIPLPPPPNPHFSGFALPVINPPLSKSVVNWYDLAERLSKEEITFNAYALSGDFKKAQLNLKNRNIGKVQNPASIHGGGFYEYCDLISKQWRRNEKLERILWLRLSWDIDIHRDYRSQNDDSKSNLYEDGDKYNYMNDLKDIDRTLATYVRRHYKNRAQYLQKFLNSVQTVIQALQLTDSADHATLEILSDHVHRLSRKVERHLREEHKSSSICPHSFHPHHPPIIPRILGVPPHPPSSGPPPTNPTPTNRPFPPLPGGAPVMPPSSILQHYRHMLNQGKALQGMASGLFPPQQPSRPPRPPNNLNQPPPHRAPLFFPNTVQPLFTAPPSRTQPNNANNTNAAATPGNNTINANASTTKATAIQIPRPSGVDAQILESFQRRYPNPWNYNVTDLATTTAATSGGGKVYYVPKGLAKGINGINLNLTAAPQRTPEQERTAHDISRIISGYAGVAYDANTNDNDDDTDDEDDEGEKNKDGSEGKNDDTKTVAVHTELQSEEEANDDNDEQPEGVQN